MSRFFLSSILFVFLAALASADTPIGTSSEKQGRFLQRNASLIEKLVDDGMELAAQSNALDRAKACGTIATRLAGEIEKATDNKDTARAAELSQHLRLVLQRGIAANLTAARREIHPGSADEKKLFEGTDQAQELIHLLDKQFKQAIVDDEGQSLEQPLLPAGASNRSKKPFAKPANPRINALPFLCGNSP
jgi:hypothetical protein